MTVENPLCRYQDTSCIVFPPSITWVEKRVAGLGAALLLAPRLEALWPDSPLFSALLLNCACTAVVFAFSLRGDNSSVYDPYWVLAPLFLAFVWKAQAPGGFWFYEPREALCIVLLWAWAVRFLVMVTESARACIYYFK